MDVQQRIDEVQFKANTLLKGTNMYTSHDVERIRHELMVCRDEVLSYLSAESTKNTAALTAAKNTAKAKEDNWEKLPNQIAFGVTTLFLLVVTVHDIVIGAMRWGLIPGMAIVTVIFFFIVKVPLWVLFNSFGPPGIMLINREIREKEAKSKELIRQKEHANAVFAELDPRLQLEELRRKQQEEAEDEKQKKRAEEDARRLKALEEARKRQLDAQYFDQKVTEGIEQMLEASEKPGPLKKMIIQLATEVKKAMHKGEAKSQALCTVVFACRINDTNLEYQIMPPNQKEKPRPIRIPFERLSSEYKKYSLCTGLITIMKFNPLVGEETDWVAEAHSVQLSDEHKQNIVRNLGLTTVSAVSFEIWYTGPNVNYEAPGALF